MSTKLLTKTKLLFFLVTKRGHANVCNLLEYHGADISYMEKETESMLGISSSGMKMLLNLVRCLKAHLVSFLVRSSRLALDAISNSLLIHYKLTTSTSTLLIKCNKTLSVLIAAGA